MRKTTTIREKIATRAYFMWLEHYRAGVVNAVLPGNDVGYWLAAERIELALIERRAASATKAAATRRAKAAAMAPAGVIVAAKSRPTCRPTAH